MFMSLCFFMVSSLFLTSTYKVYSCTTPAAVEELYSHSSAACWQLVYDVDMFECVCERCSCIVVPAQDEFPSRDNKVYLILLLSATQLMLNKKVHSFLLVMFHLMLTVYYKKKQEVYTLSYMQSYVNGSRDLVRKSVALVSHFQQQCQNSCGPNESRNSAATSKSYVHMTKDTEGREQTQESSYSSQRKTMSPKHVCYKDSPLLVIFLQIIRDGHYPIFLFCVF